MHDLDGSIEGRIRKLASETEAPSTFIEQVRVLFLSKGISLDTDAAPYEHALREAFRRELAIRRSTLRARRPSSDVASRLRALGEGYRRQVEQLRNRQRSLDRRSREMNAGLRALQRGAVVEDASLEASGTTPVQREVVPMVPGPEGAQ
jgi:hypothetical protein